MSKIKTCPYFIVDNENQYSRARAWLGAPSEDPIYDFPFKVGKDDRVFEEGGVRSIPDYLDPKTGVTYTYVLTELP